MFNIDKDVPGHTRLQGECLLGEASLDAKGAYTLADGATPPFPQCHTFQIVLAGARRESTAKVIAAQRFKDARAGFRTGNAADKFIQIDRYVAWRLKRLLIKKRGHNLRAGQAGRWTRAWFHDQGLHQLMGTIRYPKAA